MRTGALFLLTGLFCICSLPLFSQQKHEFSARDAVAYAQKNSAQVKNALLDIQIQQQQNKEITAAALPQINGSAGLNYFPNIGVQVFPNFIALGTYGVLAAEGVKDGNGNPIQLPGDVGFIQAQFGTRFNNSVGIGLQQLLFDGQVFVGLQARDAAIELRQKQAAVTEEGIRANVYKVYYQLVASKSQLEILDANIANVERTANEVQKLYENGFAEKLAVDNLQVQLSNIRTEKAKALNAINNGYVGLKLLMGMPIRDTLVLTDSISYEDIRDGVLNAAQYNYNDRKEYQVAEVGLRLGEYNIRSYRLSRLPTVALASNYSLNRQSNDFGFGGQWFRSSLIGLNVSVPVFDGFARQARIQQATLQQQQNRNNVEGLKLLIDQEVQQAINNYTNALATLDAQRRTRELAENVYNQTRIKFGEGLGTSAELSTAQTELRVSQNNYSLALYDAINARIDFLRATGKLQ